MTPRLKKLLIECHPDRHGGDHSRMEQFYAAAKRPAIDNLNRCQWPGCGVAVNHASVHCGIHWRLNKSLGNPKKALGIQK